MDNKLQHFLYCLLTAFLIILGIVVLSSCSINKKVHKEKEHTDILATNTTTTTEITTGILDVPLDSISSVSQLDSLLAGAETVTETDNFVTKTHFDKKTKTVKTKTVQKPTSIPVRIEKTTIGSITVHTKTDKKIKDKEVKTEVFQYWWIVGVCAVYIWYNQRK
jgi:hypothetical protein